MKGDRSGVNGNDPPSGTGPLYRTAFPRALRDRNTRAGLCHPGEDNPQKTPDPIPAGLAQADRYQAGCNLLSQPE
jgi:hypothetical protein